VSAHAFFCIENRQDPSIIVLVTNPDSTHALLARSPRHPPSMYTAIAGFVEAGETFESATCREVHEEVGVTIDRKSIRYIASQPWPFPRSCMIGMRACTLDGLASICVDPNEIVDAKWFEKETVYQAARDSDAIGAVLDRSVVEEKQKSGGWTGQLLVPSKGVLARTLIESWLEG
jgi:NAD+ diphosphatase